MRKIFVFLCLSVFAFSAQADLEQDLNSIVGNYKNKRSFHGNVLVKHKSETVFETSVGEAVAEWSVPHTKDSKFMVASLSKSFTSAMILILQNEGKLNIEDSVADYIKLPKVHKVDLDLWSRVTIKDLMSHRAGLKRDFKNSKSLDRSAYNLPSTILQRYFTDNKIFLQRTEPGEKFYYSNLGYLMLAVVIESAGTGFYENQLKNNIFRPLKMADTGEYHRGKFFKNMAEGYHLGERGILLKRCCDDATALRGAASLYSTSGDLMIWLEALKNSQEVFGFDLLGQMMADAKTGEEESLYGFGLQQSSFGNTYRLSHTGHEWGYVSSMSYYPEEDLEVVVLSNRHEFLGFGGVGAADELGVEIAELILKSKKEELLQAKAPLL